LMTLRFIRRKPRRLAHQLLLALSSRDVRVDDATRTRRGSAFHYADEPVASADVDTLEPEKPTARKGGHMKCR
jgi:hypothetical protein